MIIVLKRDIVNAKERNTMQKRAINRKILRNTTNEEFQNENRR